MTCPLENSLSENYLGYTEKTCTLHSGLRHTLTKVKSKQPYVIWLFTVLLGSNPRNNAVLTLIVKFKQEFLPLSSLKKPRKAQMFFKPPV